jgi:flagellar biosynthetic protein FlhB
VVVTNPTELAVAIKYDQEKMNAPMVVAKGRNKIAQKIKEIALDCGIPVIENKPLAQALYKLVDVGQIIPEKLYHAVAELLAYVYGLRKKVR